MKNFIGTARSLQCGVHIQCQLESLNDELGGARVSNAQEQPGLVGDLAGGEAPAMGAAPTTNVK